MIVYLAASSIKARTGRTLAIQATHVVHEAWLIEYYGSVRDVYDTYAVHGIIALHFSRYMEFPVCDHSVSPFPIVPAGWIPFFS